MDGLEDRQVELPDPERSAGRIVWDISRRGLEWTGGHARAAWMPFACMQRITLGHLGARGGWRLGLSGPPGRVLIGASHPGATAAPEDEAQFVALASDIVRASLTRGCPPKFRINDRAMRSGFLWMRLGRSVPEADELLARLAVSLK